ncbi:reverse transcriptase family protein, partial [Pseudomonas aeruginosa]
MFPDLMKYSKIIPLFKSGSTFDPTNFRPISVLPTLSKIFEKIILEQLLNHFYSNNLLHNKQYGFTRGRSTIDAGVDLIKNIFQAWEESHNALGVFCDLSKTFDCVEHNTLLRKLHHYGIRGVSLELIKSYLSGRIQKVDVKGTRSSGVLLNMGVPQGSILGPFLFLVYINDLPKFIETRHEVVLFADDTSLLFKIKRQLEDYDDVNDAISRVVHWFSVNNLLLNNKKTKCIKFTTPNVRQVDTNIIVSGETLELVDSTVFLGITVDSRLQWGPHICKLANRLSSAAFAVKKIRTYTDEDTARLVYFSYFHSVMSYGILLWGNAADVET